MKTLTRKQTLAIGSLAALSPLLRLVPAVNVAAAGNAGWLSGIAALPLLLCYGRLLERRPPAPAGAGRGTRAALGLWLVFYGGFLLRMSAERFFAALGVFTGWQPFAAGLMALSIPMAAAGRTPLGRAAQLFLPAATGILLLAGLCAIPQTEWSALRSVRLGDAPGILRGALPIAGIGAAAMLAMALLAPEGPGAGRRFSLRFCLVAVGVSAMAVGVLGRALTTHLSHPFFILLRNLSLSRAMERIEALIAAVWVLPDAVMLAVLLLLSRELPPRPRPVWVPALGMLAAAALLSPTAFGLAPWSETIVPALNGAVVLAVPIFAARKP